MPKFITFEELINLKLSTFIPLILFLIVLFLVVVLFQPKSAQNSNIKVKELIVYPIKGCKGISLQSMEITKTGFLNDRQFMFVDSKNNFITQRQHPIMSLIEIQLDPSHNRLIVSAQSMPNHASIPLIAADDSQTNNPVRSVSVWGQDIQAYDCGDEISKWIQTYLKIDFARLVRKSDKFVRKCALEYAPSGQVIFADGFPFLLTSVESLNLLNSKLNKPIPMENFRPNIVIEGLNAPFEEDEWISISIGRNQFQIVKPCSRCKVPNIHQDTGKLDESTPVTEAMKTFRTGKKLGYSKDAWQSQVFFGQNLDHTCALGSRLSVGDNVSYKCGPI